MNAPKLLTRDDFREGVFARDNHKCVFCGEPAVVESPAIVNNQLVGVIRPLGTPTGKLLKEMLIAERDDQKILSFRTAGRADAIKNGKMINYKFLCVFACPYQEN